MSYHDSNYFTHVYTSTISLRDQYWWIELQVIWITASDYSYISYKKLTNISKVHHCHFVISVHQYQYIEFCILEVHCLTFHIYFFEIGFIFALIINMRAKNYWYDQGMVAHLHHHFHLKGISLMEMVCFATLSLKLFLKPL